MVMDLLSEVIMVMDLLLEVIMMMDFQGLCKLQY